MCGNELIKPLSLLRLYPETKQGGVEDSCPWPLSSYFIFIDFGSVMSAGNTDFFQPFMHCKCATDEDFK